MAFEDFKGEEVLGLPLSYRDDAIQGFRFYVDQFHVDYIEFVNEQIQVGEAWGKPSVGGAPMAGMPMRAEPFLYGGDPSILLPQNIEVH